MTDNPLVEAVAKHIAHANGDEFANAFANKTRWIAKRGMSGGRFRDASEPFQHDYIDMATAALRAIEDAGYTITPTAAPSREGQL